MNDELNKEKNAGHGDQIAAEHEDSAHVLRCKRLEGAAPILLGCVEEAGGSLGEEVFIPHEGHGGLKEPQDPQRKLEKKKTSGEQSNDCYFLRSLSV